MSLQYYFVKYPLIILCFRDLRARVPAAEKDFRKEKENNICTRFPIADFKCILKRCNQRCFKNNRLHFGGGYLSSKHIPINDDSLTVNKILSGNEVSFCNLHFTLPVLPHAIRRIFYYKPGICAQNAIINITKIYKYFELKFTVYVSLQTKLAKEIITAG